MTTATALVPRTPAELALTGPLGSFDAYLDRVTRIPVLSREDEQGLALSVLRDWRRRCRARLVLSHLRFVVHIARGYAGYGLPIGDLVQEGNIGLMKAVKRFDPDMGVRLVSFAVYWIRAEIHEYVLRNWRLVKVATTKAQRKLFFNLRQLKKGLGWLSAAETPAVARTSASPSGSHRDGTAPLGARPLVRPVARIEDDDDSSSYSPPPTFRPRTPTRPWRSKTRNGPTKSASALRTR